MVTSSLRIMMLKILRAHKGGIKYKTMDLVGAIKTYIIPKP